MKYLTLCFILLCLANVCVSAGEAKTSGQELYKVDINDIVEIKVDGHPEFSIIATVIADGTITYPSIGVLYVKGMTVLEIQKVITNRLSPEYIISPVISVNLRSASKQMIYFLFYGEIKGPGEVIYEKDLTAVKALAKIGGLIKDIIYGSVKLRRKQEGATGYNDINIDVKGIIEGRVKEDILLKPDDILIVIPIKKFYIQGEVVKPGEYIPEDGMTIGRAITIAGGITKEGMHGRVKLRRKYADNNNAADYVAESGISNGIIISREIDDMLLRSDDILIVERSKSVFIEGEVEKPGQYILESDLTVGKAITVAGGITEGGQHGKVKVRRKRENVAGYDDIEIDIKGIIEGSVKEDMLLQPDDILIVERNKTIIVYGEVNNIGEFPYEDGMTVFKAIVTAGGFSKWGSPNRVKILRHLASSNSYVTVKVNINDVLDGKADSDIVLQPGDIIVVSSGIF